MSKPGGANTNKNGLAYEEVTALLSNLSIQDHNYISLKKNDFLKFLKEKKIINDSKKIGHGCKKPDECFLNEEKKIIIIIEKKFQKRGGSVCEKIQTVDFKLWQFRKLLPDHQVHYVYCLSNWFKENCKSELEYLQSKNIPVFWGEEKNYKKDIENFIINC